MNPNPIAFRFTEEDLAILDELRESTGIENRTDILRLAIRQLSKKFPKGTGKATRRRSK